MQNVDAAKGTTNLPNVPSESLEKKRKTHALLLQLLLPLPRNHAKDEPLRHTKTPPNFVPKRRPKGTTKLSNVPSEFLEKMRKTHALLLQLLLLPLPRKDTRDEPFRHTKTPPNFVPKKRPKGTTKLSNVPSESLEKVRKTHAFLLQLLLLPLPRQDASPRDEPLRQNLQEI